MPGRFRPSAPILVIAAVLFGAMLPIYIRDLSHDFHIDFVAYWCAGSSILHHQDPYLDASVHQCNVSLGLLPSLTLPIAHPPYVMPVFALMALLPENVSFTVWCAILIACSVLAVLALCRLTQLDWTLMAAAAYLLLIPSLEFGQLVPIPLCAFCWALLFVRDERPWAAAGALCVSAMLPNFAEGAWIAAFLFFPRIRVPLIATGTALLLIGAACVHWSGLLEYVTEVLPAYGRSELSAFWQLGSAATIHAVGFSERTALAASYALLVVMLAAGLYVGWKLRERFSGTHWILATVAVFGILGAPYAHETDIVFALPLALMLLAAVPESPLVKAGALVIVVPWQHLMGDTGIQSAIVIAPLFVVAGALFPRPAIAAGIVAIVVLGSLAFYRYLGSADAQLIAAQRLPQQMLPQGALAEVRWTEFTQMTHSPASGILYRTFSYAALGFLLFAAARATAPESRSSNAA